MNKTELGNAVATKLESTKAHGAEVVDAVLEVITESLEQGDPVKLIGFGNFEVRERAARLGRNPKSGEEIQIEACKVPAFKAGKPLKDKVKNS